MKIRKFILVIIIISFTAGSLYGQHSTPLKLKNEISVLKDSVKNTKKLSYKSPAIAGCLSFFVPGAALGQIYNEDYGKFALHAGISGAILITLLIANQSGWIVIGPISPGGEASEESKNKSRGGTLLVICVLSYIGNWLWSTIDAIHSATMNNREMEQKRARLKDRTQKSVNYNFGFGLDRNNKLIFKTILNF